jgi:hypothetical protein
MDRRWQHVMEVVGLTAALLGLMACPPTKPPVNPTPDADAASPPPDCAVACNHYGIVCKGSLAICDRTCPGAEAVDPGYTVCLAGAGACMNCDATARAGQSAAPGAPKPHGK